MADHSGHMEADEFRRQGHRMIDWVADYLDGQSRNHPVLAQVSPGDVSARLAPTMPDRGEDLDEVWQDFLDVVPDIQAGTDDADGGSGRDPLEPPRVHGLFRHHRLGPWNPRRIDVRRTQCQRHAVAHQPVGHRTRTAHPGLAPNRPRSPR